MAEQSDNVLNRLRLAGAVAARVQIAKVRLESSRLKRHILDDSILPKTAQLSHGVNVTYGYSAEAKHIQVLVAFFVSAKTNSGDQGRDIFQIECRFALDYVLSGDEPPGDEEVAAFAKLNGIYNAWPYCREYVQSTASRMGLPPIVLPVLMPGAIEKIVRQGEEQATGEVAEKDEGK